MAISELKRDMRFTYAADTMDDLFTSFRVIAVQRATQKFKNSVSSCEMRISIVRDVPEPALTFTRALRDLNGHVAYPFGELTAIVNPASSLLNAAGPVVPMTLSDPGSLPTMNSSFSVARARFVIVALLAAFSAMAFRVAYLQTAGRQQTIRRAESQQHQSHILPHRRGSIYDRNGMELAGTVQTPSLFIDPKFLQDQFQQEGRSLVEMDGVVSKLAKLIDKDPFELSQLLGEKTHSRYIRVADHLDDSTVAAIRKLDLPGVGIEGSNVRNYPMGSIAAHLLGGTGAGGRGLEGLELQYEKTLSGKDGFERTLKDARHRPLSTAAYDYLPPKHGQHLMLTIDANIQMIVEQELAQTCKDTLSKRGEAVVMNPKTGEILAMANWPTFNPENLEDSRPDLRRNRALIDPYEPGSTIKPFIVGPALEWNVTRVNEVWKMPGGGYKSSLRRKLVTDVHNYPELATWDVLVKSSNIGMTMIGERLGKKRVYAALNQFQFGHATGVEMPGEDPGYLKAVPKWADSDVVSAVQGYSVMVTPLQLARAFCVYANGGRLVKPTLVRGMLDADGGLVSKNNPNRLEMMPEVVDPITAAEMKRILCDTVVRGTASKARSDTWNIFGKTGTAHVSGGKAGYSEDRYNVSFLAGAPAEDPQIVVAFIIHEPNKKHALANNLSYYGGAVAAPGASKLIERTLTYLQTPASPELEVPPPQIANVLYNFNAKQYQRKTPVITVSASLRD
jgi:cell division protein FtsI/penicillin-binding protein 2